MSRVQNTKLQVGELLGRPGAVKDFTLEVTLEDVGGSLARLDPGTVSGDLRAEAVVEGILITGSLEAGVALECSRCLKPASSAIEARVVELYYAPDREPEGDDEPYRIKGLELDLEPMLRDVLGLELPLRPLCREGCKGLCATCGADLNAGDCGCVEETHDPRWAGLDELKARLQN